VAAVEFLERSFRLIGKMIRHSDFAQQTGVGFLADIWVRGCGRIHGCHGGKQNDVTSKKPAACRSVTPSR
jgi:hypothetical protein